MPGLEHVVSQSSTVVGSPGSTVRQPPAALAGDVLEVGQDALAALRAAVRRGDRHVEVECPDSECRFPLLLVDDSAPAFDGWGRPQYEPAVYVIESGEGTDPELGQLDRCPGCLDEIRPDLVIVRERGAVAC